MAKTLRDTPEHRPQEGDEASSTVRGPDVCVTSRSVLTVEEAAQLMRISRGSAYEAARCGQLPTIRIGRRLLVPRAALERLLEQAGMVHEERGGAHGR